MKTFIILMSLLLLSTADARPKLLSPVETVVPAAELTPEFMKEFISGAHPDTAIAFDKGASMPLHLLCNCRLLSIAFDPKLTVYVHTPWYLRFAHKRAYMSLDLIDWERPDRFFEGRPEPRVTIDRDRVLVEVNIVD